MVGPCGGGSLLLTDGLCLGAALAASGCSTGPGLLSLPSPAAVTDGSGLLSLPSPAAVTDGSGLLSLPSPAAVTDTPHPLPYHPLPS
jgi:hypothetical protein